MTDATRHGLTLDAGALIAIDRDAQSVRAICDEAIQRGGVVHVLPDVLAQVWRGGQRQVLLARFLNIAEVEFPEYDHDMGRAVGVVCGASGHSDVVDVHVAVHARFHGHRVVTSDPDDLRRVDPTLRIVEI